MERWEAILDLYSYHPDVNRYKCKVCGKLYKSDPGIYDHIDNTHSVEINALRDKAIVNN